MCTTKILFLSFFVTQGISYVVSARIGGKSLSTNESCILPPHPSYGWWSLVNQPSLSTPGLKVPPNSVLRIFCEDTFKLDGCEVVLCVGGTWLPKIGQCLKTCPPIYSTSTLNVTCIFKEQETINCTEPIEGTLARFKCASFYEDTRLSKPKAVCVDGRWSDSVPECSPVCGRAALKKSPTLIVRGKKTNKGDFPWQIAIYTVEDKVLICGGTLLSERVVLTAAHCISNDDGTIYPKDQYVVAAGKYYRKFDHPDDQEYSQISQIHDMFISERYADGSQNFEGDIAIIVTKTPFKFSIAVQPVCIDWSKKFEDVILGSGKPKGFVSGWGHTKQNSEPAAELRSLSVPSIPRTECREILPEEYRRYMTRDKFCAGYKDNGTSVCSGDSGGGLAFKREGRFFIAGVVSLAPRAETPEGGCDSQQYSLYTLVYNYTDNFILKKLIEFKSLDTKDEVCKNCTVTETPTTEPQPTEPPSGDCILPQHPEFGRWVSVRRSSQLHPGGHVQTSTAIKVTCNHHFKYDGPRKITCINGNWSSKIGKCLKICPSLHSSSKIEVSCKYKDDLLETCSDAVDGTVANFKCGSFHEFASVVTKPSVCVNGNWSFVPKCQPTCGQLPSKVDSEALHPWHVTIYRITNDTKSVWCSGTLINTKLIITAARCLFASGKVLPRKELIVTAGKYHQDFDHQDVDVQTSKPEEILISRQYQGDITNYVSDIAMVILMEPFVLSDKVQPVCLDWTTEVPLPFNKRSFLTGWNVKEPASLPKSYIFKILPLKECTQIVNEDDKRYLTYDKLCGLYTGNNSDVSFDGGLIVKENNKYYLSGVFSLSATSKKGNLFLFTGLAFYIDDFILNEEIKYRD